MGHPDFENGEELLIQCDIFDGFGTSGRVHRPNKNDIDQKHGQTVGVEV